MSDDQHVKDPGAERDLRTVTSRLADLQRKCRSAGSRTTEAMEIEERLGSILQRLEPEDEDQPVPFAALARELYAVERFFESNGFITVAKEVAHVERALEELATDSDTVDDHDEPTPQPAEEILERDLAVTAELDEETPSRWAIPRPLAVVFLLFVIAVAVCAAVIYRIQNPPAAPVAAAPTPVPVVRVITATPAPRTDSGRDGRSLPATPVPGAILAAEVGRARLALAEGDVDAVIDHLSRAALIDPDHSTVLGTANSLVDLLVDRADAAAEAGLWEVADLTLARASRIASRYGLDHQPIEETSRRHARMDRFRLVKPNDLQALRAAAGSRVTVHLKGGETRDSIIKGTDGNHLLLDEDTEVRGGAMYYTERIPLGDIDFLKVWE